MARLPATAGMLPAVQDGRVTTKHFLEKIVPVGVLFAFSLALGNQAYLYLSVSFIQMLKAFTPVAVLLASQAFGMETPTVAQIAIVSCISIGVSITAVGELQFSLLGFLFQVGGILAEACRLVLADKLIKDLKLDSLSTIYYVAPVSFATIGTGFVLFEMSKFPVMVVLENHVPILLLNGFAAFALNIAIVLLMANTSALVLSLGGIVKDILLVACSFVFFQSPVTSLQIFGYTISLASMNLYKDYKTNPEKFLNGSIERWNSLLSLVGMKPYAAGSTEGSSEATGKLLDSAAREEREERSDYSNRPTRSSTEIRDQFRTSGVVKV